MANKFIQIMSNNILHSFIKQTYGSVENAIQQSQEADKREALEKEFADIREKKAIAQMCTPIDLSKHFPVPTRLSKNELNKKTEVHPNFKNYDHNLETNRSSKLGLISLENPTEE